MARSFGRGHWPAGRIRVPLMACRVPSVQVRMAATRQRNPMPVPMSQPVPNRLSILVKQSRAMARTPSHRFPLGRFPRRAIRSHSGSARRVSAMARRQRRQRPPWAAAPSNVRSARSHWQPVHPQIPVRGCSSIVRPDAQSRCRQFALFHVLAARQSSRGRRSTTVG